VWYLDFIIGALIFSSLLVIFFIQIQNLQEPEENELTQLVDQASDISNELLTEGVPLDWTPSNFTQVGIAKNQRINNTKFNNFVGMNYSAVKNSFRTTNQFFIFLEQDGCVQPINANYGVGHGDVSVTPSACVTRSDIDLSTINVHNLVTINRLVIYNGKAAKIGIYLWN
jgi:hypothetical protein